MGVGRKTFDSCMLVLTSGAVSKDVWIYLESLDQEVLASRRPDEGLGINHCVHERRITEEDQTKEKVSLDQLLKRNQWCPERGIIAISAPEDGYAKDYFAERLMTLAYDQLKDQSGNIRNFWCLMQKAKNWYLPVLVMPEALEDYRDGVGMASICTDSVKLWLKKYKNIQWNERQYVDFQRFMAYMLQKGQVLLLLPRGYLEDISKNIQELIIREFCKEKREHGNIAIYVVEREKEFCSPQYRYPVELGELLTDEIMDHIRFVVKGNSKIVDFFDKLLKKDNSLLKKELPIPERLLLLSKLLGENGYEDKHISMKRLEAMKSTVQLYEFIIRKSIEICVKKACGGSVDNGAQLIIYETLKDIAWKGIDEGRENGLVDRVNEDFQKKLNSYWMDRLKGDFQIWSKLTADKDFLVNKNYNFYFVGCKHYLIAENLFSLFRKEMEAAKAALSNPVFLEKSNSQIYLFLIDIIKDRVQDEEIKNQYFDIIWNSITDDRISGENNRVQVLADILERYESIENITYSIKLVEFVLKELSNQYYDSNIFDALHLINSQYKKLKINHYLKEQYSKLRNSKNTDAVDNQKRRLVYYFGKEKCGIPEAVIEDLVDLAVHIHVKYHIMLAIIENYNSNVEDLLENHEQKIRDCVKDWKKDVILYSDYLTLEAKRNNGDRETGSTENTLQGQLFQELEKGEYWKRAHAAGALGRQRLLKSVNELLNRLSDEIARIPKEENSLKSVSYMVEAICEIFFWQNNDIVGKQGNDSKHQRYQEELKNSIKRFMKLISLDGQQDIEKIEQSVCVRYFVVFATVSEGIIYLAESVEDRKPEEIGRHIKGGRKDLGGKRKAIGKAIEIASKMFPEESGYVEQKQLVDDLYNRLYTPHTTGSEGNIGSKQEDKEGSTEADYVVNNSGPVENQTNIEAQNVLQFNISVQDMVKATALEKDTDSSSNGMI